jgi:hypothetical protein
MSLDHLVYATPDLAQSVRRIAELTGVEPVEGGRHSGLGTRNYLLGLGGLRYLEIVGPDRSGPEPSRARPFGIDDLVEPRLMTWALRVGEIETCVAGARSQGYDPGPIEPLSRRTPDGRTLSWRHTFRYDAVVPFLIDWGETPHPARDLPAAPLTSLVGSHPEPAKARARLAALGAELPVEQGEPGLVAVIGGAIVK